jgi:oxalate decarboxylase
MLFAGLGTVLEGYVSGLAYTNLGDLYAGFMSGNSGHLAQQLFQLNWAGIGIALSVIVIFVFGVSLGTALLDNVPSRWSISSVLALSATAAAISLHLSLDGAPSPSALALVVLVGVHSVLHRKVDGVDLGRGYVTGYLVAVGEALARPGRTSPVLLSIAAWMMLVLGVLLGTTAFHVIGQAGGTSIVLIALSTAEVALWRFEHDVPSKTQVRQALDERLQ